jgi:peptidoglycan/xylan/chitin deacetylase (PgdA/CDA1 family)
MFHSVGLEHHPWAWNHISEPITTFEAKIARLKASGFTGVFWRDLYDHMAGTRTLPDDSILLTFDDGYLDNWVHVYPVLKKYGMKGTIFVSPDFVDPSTEVRPSMDDVDAGRCSPEALQIPGFLNWAEMREMELSGLVDIQSHAMTHTWYFNSPSIERFHAPHEITPYPWLFWNARPERKPFYLNEDQQEFVPWGSPILRHGKSLEARRFFPAQDAMDEFSSFVETRGGAEFFCSDNWQEVLDGFATKRFGETGVPGVYESDEAREARLYDELDRSKGLIEENLKKNVDYICWPGGANDETVQEIARRVGFKAWTLSSSSEQRKRNLPGADPESIKRIGTSNRLTVRGRFSGYGGARYQVWSVLAHQESRLHALMIRAYKLVAPLTSRKCGPQRDVVGKPLGAQ